MPWTDLRSLAAITCLAAAAFGLAVPPAVAQGVKPVFDKLDLVGNYRQNCKNAISEQNLYIRHQAVEGDRVRHEQFSSATNRLLSVLIDRATQSKPNELSMGGLAGDKRHTVVLRIDNKRIRVIESAQEGAPAIVTAGRYADGKGETPWFEKCLGPESVVATGAHSPERINEDIERLLAKRMETNPNPAARGSHFNIVYARNPAEFAGLARYSVMLLVVMTQKPEDLPLKRVFHRAGGQDTPIVKVSSWRGEVPAAMVARKIYGPHREDGFYIIPTGFMMRDGQLFIEYAGTIAPIAILKLPGTAAPNATKNLGNLDPVPGAKPNLGTLQAFLKYYFPGFPVPTSLP